MAPQDTVAGFIGLGTMGSALSAHLLAAGWAVTGYDIDPSRLAAHAGRGGGHLQGPLARSPVLGAGLEAGRPADAIAPERQEVRRGPERLADREAEVTSRGFVGVEAQSFAEAAALCSASRARSTPAAGGSYR